MKKDYSTSLVSCNKYRESISAALDGEATLIAQPDLERHLAGCPDCAAWGSELSMIVRSARLAPLPSTDLAEKILRSAATVRARSSLSTVILRAALLAVAVGQALLSMPSLMDASDSMNAPMHMAHESGGWNLALGIAFLTVVLRPRYAAAFLPMIGVLAGVFTIFCTIDLVAGQVTWQRLMTHLLMVGGLVLLAFIAYSRRARGDSPAMRLRYAARRLARAT